MIPLPIDAFDYPLPDERIAKYPLPERDHSKLLVYHDGQIGEDRFDHIGTHLIPKALLVYNNTRVIQARLAFRKPTGARIELFCLEPIAPHDYQLALGSTVGCTWKCMIGNAKKWHSGALLLPITDSLSPVTLSAYKEAQNGNTFTVRFEWNGTNISFAEILDAIGELPIPPYLNRPTEESDKTTYQTVYSRIKGSVAAPTAGLHFTQSVLDDLHRQGVQTAELTLHVGAGTFQPVKVDDANNHTMHTEIIAVPLATLKTLRQQLEHIVAVGTTSMRTLESLYWLGKRFLDRNGQTTVEMRVEQFEPYTEDEVNTIPPSSEQTLTALIDYLEQTGQDTLHAETQIMIRPGYRFRLVRQLVTNFHQPRSTLLLLVSAFVGDDWKQIYQYALQHDFRFLSYGDSSILTLRQSI